MSGNTNTTTTAAAFGETGQDYFSPADGTAYFLQMIEKTRGPANPNPNPPITTEPGEICERMQAWHIQYETKLARERGWIPSRLGC